jgi:hypothetical protein
MRRLTMNEDSFYTEEGETPRIARVNAHFHGSFYAEEVREYRE